MKISDVGVAPVFSGLLILASIRVSDAAKDSITVPYGGIEFAISHYDDGRSSPYAIVYWDNNAGVKSVYRFGKDGFVTELNAGDESYNLVYDGNGALKKVKRTSSRRKLAEGSEEGGVQKATVGTPSGGTLADQSVESLADKEGGGTSSRIHLDADLPERSDPDLTVRRTPSSLRRKPADLTAEDGPNQTVKHSSSVRRNLAADQAEERAALIAETKRISPWHQLANKQSEDHNSGADVSVEELASSGRKIAKETEDSGDDADALSMEQLVVPASGRRRMYEDCEDCELTWETLCANGVETVCNLDGYGKPILPSAQGSIDVFCSMFGTACAELTASEACGGCPEEEEEEEECLPPLTITLDWSSEVDRVGGEIPLLLLHVIEPGGQIAFHSNPETDMGSMSFRTYTLHEGLGLSGMTTFIAFAEWSEGLAPIDWSISATGGDGGSLKSGQGLFTGDCSASSTSSSTYSYSDHGTSRGTTIFVYVTLFDYVENGCNL